MAPVQSGGLRGMDRTGQPEEFHADACRVRAYQIRRDETVHRAVDGGESIDTLAREFGTTPDRIRGWIAAARGAKGTEHLRRGIHAAALSGGAPRGVNS